MTDPRIVRLEQIAAALRGKVLDHDGDLAEIEVPNASAAASMLGASGFSAFIIGQDQRMAPRWVTTMGGFQVVDQAAMDLTTYHRFRVELRRVEDKPNAAIALTRPTRPHGG